MNRVRIDVVRALREMGNAISGIYPDYYAQDLCPDILASKKHMTKRCYLNNLRISDICITNEGLKCSPGWKIGEYVAGSKCVVTNEIKCVIPEFREGVNYQVFDDPSNVIDIVFNLRLDKSYKECQVANWEYSSKHLHPDVYFQHLVDSV